MAADSTFQRRPFGDILTALREGEGWAWEALYEELSPVLLGYLRMQNAPSPTDQLSEVFLHVVRDLDQFSGDRSSFRSWVFTIAHHRLIDARRYSQRRPAYATEHDELDRELPADRMEPQVLERLTVEELQELLRCITPDQREVILLRTVGNLTMRETAAVLDKGYEACRALQRRGLKSLREELGREPYPFQGGAALSSVR